MTGLQRGGRGVEITFSSGKLRTALFIFIMFSVLAVVALAYITHNVRERIPVTAVSIKPTPDGAVRLEKVHYSGSKDGRLEWEMDADIALYNRKTDLVTLEGVVVKFFPRDGGIYTLKSRRGSYDGKTGVIDALGDVQVKTSDGYSLRSESLRYSNTLKELTSDVFVKILGSAIMVRGTGLVLDLDKGRLRILKGVRAHLTNDAS